MKKKFISFLLAAIMVVTFLPVIAFAHSDVLEDHGFKVFNADGNPAFGVEKRMDETLTEDVDYYWENYTLCIVKDGLTVSGEGKPEEDLFVGQGDTLVSSVTFKDLSTPNTIYMKGPTNSACTLTLTFEGENKIGNAQGKPDAGIKFTGNEMVVTGEGSLTIFDKYDGILPGEGEDGFDLTFDGDFTGTLTVIDDGDERDPGAPQPSCAISISNGALSVYGGTLNLISISKSAITANEVTIGNNLVVYAGNSPETVQKLISTDDKTQFSQHYVCIAPKSHCKTINGDSGEFTPWLSIDTLPSSAGSWHLTNDVTLNETWNVPTSAGITNLCLNGHVINASDGAFSVITVGSGAALNLYDCNSEGQTHYYKYSSTAAWEYIASPTDIKIASAVTIGAITDNTRVVAISGGAITGGKGNPDDINTHGGGVYVYSRGTFNMYGGAITGNTAVSGAVRDSKGNGGGVYNKGTFTMLGGEITGNEATSNGGGVYVAENGIFTMSNGAITGNTTSFGGGVCVVKHGVFTMFGSSIISNNVGKNGGGMYVVGKFNMTGGEIVSNKATAYGGGVIHNSSQIVTLGGIAKITGNVYKGEPNNVYLANKCIALGTGDDAPTGDMLIGVTTNTPPREGNPVQITTNGSAGDEKYFFSDDTAYAVKYESKQLKLVNAYSITNDAKEADKETNHGYIEVAASAYAGQSVNITVHKNEGYKLKSLVVSDNSIEIASTSATTYVFTMPAVNVIVTAEFEPNVYKVSFDANGHGTSPAAVNITYGTVVTKPADPTESGWTFDGWYKQATCTDLWNFETDTVATDTTLYAKWTEIPAPPAPVDYGDVTYYDVLTSAGVNGTIDVDKKSASYGSTVTVTVTPEKGFALETLTVLDKNGKEIDVKDTKEKNKYTFRMPSSKVTVNATFMEDNTMLNYCVDVKKEDYFYDSVLWAYENEICNGTDELHFSPAKTLTRAEAVTMLWRIAGKPVVNYWMQFKDVESGRYYTEAVRWAASEKIAIGYSDEKFGTTDLITREQLAKMIYGYVQKKGQGFTGSWMFLLPYEDRAKISDWANEAAHWCSMKGVINGKDENLFDPQGTATRAEAITMLYRFDSLMK